MTSFEESDIRADEYRLRLLDSKASEAETLHLAQETALRQHPVVGYVLGLPIQSAVVSCHMYHKFTSTGNGQEAIPDQLEEGQESPSKDHISGNSTDDLPLPSRVHNYITWCMPGHDTDRPSRKGCGFIRASDDTTVYTACPKDHHHHCKAKNRHCWSLRCPRCMNDTALKKAVNVERQLLLYKGLMEKSGQYVGNISHWVVSPPQEMVKELMQTSSDFDDLNRYIEAELIKFGATAGFTVFHPWRQTKNIKIGEYWELSPHFHMLLFGRIDTTSFRKENPGWIIKKIHPRERIRSIRHTVAYLMTHMGLGFVDIEPEDVDWDLDFLDYMIPGIKSPTGHYRPEEYEAELEGKGRMAGDLSGIDWEQWTMDRLYRDTRVRYWGGVSRRNIVSIDIYRQYKIRVCKECGELLRTYDGLSDNEGQLVRYIADHKIVSFRNNADLVRQFFLRYKSQLREGDLNEADLARIIPCAICSIELGLDRNDDLVMDGPFDEPDEYFLSRQRRAFGPDESVQTS